MAKVRLQVLLLPLSLSYLLHSINAQKISKGSCTITKTVTHCHNLTLVNNSPLKIENCTKTLKIHRPIAAIPPGVFTHLPQVETLIINSTLIDKIDSDSFDGLTNLRELDLYWNELASIPSRAFSDCCTKLIYLNLGSNNLESLNGKIFDNLKLLKKLIISSNYLSGVPNLENLHALETLDLSKNEIRYLRKKSFKNLSNLLTLNLKGNQINYIEKDAFIGMKKLKTLNLERNELETLDVTNIKSNLQNLQVIGLTTNNFPCKLLKYIVQQFSRLGVNIPEGLAEPGPISYHGIFCITENYDNYV